MRTVQDFGDSLIRTQDLDPVYVAMRGAKLPEPQLCRALLAYWCFYHLGAAAWLSEQEGAQFWHYMLVAAHNDTLDGDVARGTGLTRWPRAAERRHFRGQKCVDAVQWLSKHHPESWVRNLIDQGTEKKVMYEVQMWPMFGPWIAFKVADMLERVYGAKVSFDANDVLMYEEPRKSLDMLAVDFKRPADVVYQKLLTYFSARRAPPAMDRYCGPQEVETVLCKHKSHRAGHYEVGKDIREVRHALAGWGETAERMLRACPQEVTP